MRPLRNLLRNGYYAVRGGGKRLLEHKREYHRRRSEAERQVLVEARTNPALFTDNRCPACGETHSEPRRFANPLGFQFAVCPPTGTIYMDPVPTDATLGRLYNDPAYAFHWTEAQGQQEVTVKPHGRDELRHILSVFSFPADRRPRLLDVGCATGGFLLVARDRFDVAGVELGAETADVARRQGLEITTGRLQDVPGEQCFDVITMLQLIEHITDPVEMLHAAKRLLRPGGLVYLNTPNPDSASFALFGARHMHVSSFGHVSLYTRAGLERLAERCGLRLKAHAYCGGTDIELHDLVTWRLARHRFVHRMALYHSRLYHASNLVDQLTLGTVRRAMTPPGHESYHWAALERPLVGN